MKKDAAFYSFKEYLTAKDKVVTKPPVEEVPDYKGPKSTAPPKAVTKGKGWSIPKNGKLATTQPYAAPGKKGATKNQKGGFGDMGNNDLEYYPAGKGAAGNNKKWPDGNTTTEAFLAKTKDMNTSQFAKYVKKSLTEHCGCENKKAPHVVAYSVGAYHPDPIQAIKYVTYLANENANLRRALIREANRVGCSAELLFELMQLPESFTTLARIIDGEKGASFTRKLERAIRENRDAYRKKAKLHEEVDEPAHDDDIDVDSTDKDLSLDDDDLDLGDGEDDEGEGDDLGDGEGDDLGDGEGDEGEGDDLDLDGDTPGGDVPGNRPSPHDDGGELGDDDGPPPPPHDDGGELGDDDGSDDDGSDAKIDFDDDKPSDDLDDDDLDHNDDDDLDDDEHHDDDEDLDAPKKKMPWDD